MHQVLANSIHESTKSVVTIIAGTVATIKARVIALKAGGSVVTIDDSGITIKGAKITLTGKGGINLRAPTIGEN
jgi:type VI secretion system secreted protein VgrG